VGEKEKRPRRLTGEGRKGDAKKAVNSETLVAHTEGGEKIVGKHTHSPGKMGRQKDWGNQQTKAKVETKGGQKDAEGRQFWGAGKTGSVCWGKSLNSQK